MPTTLTKQSGKELAKKNALDKYIHDVASGKISPFKSKLQIAKKNLKKAGLIK